MSKVKIYTLRGVGIKGQHVEKFSIVEVDEADAGICVGSKAALFVQNEEEAIKQANAARKAAGMKPLPGAKADPGKDDK